MRQLTAFLTALAFLLAPMVAWADDPIEVELHYTPTGKRLHCSGEEFQCYTFAEWKSLLLADANLWTTTQELELVRTSLGLRIEELDIQHQINLNLAASNGELVIELSRVRTVNDTLLKENMRLSMPKPGPWVVFVAGLVLLGVGGGMMIGANPK